MESPEVQNSQPSKPGSPDSSVAMSQASQPARAPDPSVVVSQPSVGGVIGKHSVHTGRTVGPFEIQTLIAAGAFAEVYEARGELVGAAAVKIGPLLEPRRFERELSALKGVNHPNLIKFHEGGTFTQEGKEFFWLAMEYPGPTTLATLIERKELDSASAMELFGQLLDALVALHGAGFAHRDLKPRNILVNGGRLKLIDFGLTKTARSGDDSLTITGQLVGTPRYMSPEQVRGVTEVGQAADLWAAGVILFEMLTFVPLFDGLNQMQLGAQILTQNIPSRLTHDRVPGTLRKWLIDLLNRDDPRARGSIKEARAIFGTLASPLIVRLKDVTRRSAWRKVDESRLLNAFLAGEAPGASPIDVARRFVLFAEKHGINGLRVEDVVQVISSPDGAVDVLPELKPELRPEFSIQLDASPQLLKQLEQLRLRAQFLWIGCALSVVAGGASLTALMNVSRKAGSVTYFGELALFGILCVVAAVLSGAFAHITDENRRRLLPVRRSVPVPTWEHCPGQFSILRSADDWDQRYKLAGKKDAFPVGAGLGFEAAPLFGDSDMLELANAGRILALRLSRCRKLTDYGFSVIPTLTHLEALWLDDTRIGALSLREISGLKSLRRLDLAVCRELDAAAATTLARIKELAFLDLSFNSWVNASSLDALAALEKLHSLSLAGCDGVDTGALQKLACLPSLRFLNLRWCRAIRDDGLAALKQATRLTTLDLRGNPHVTDSGLLQLSEMKYLSRLHIAECPNVRPFGLKELRRALPMCSIDFEGILDLPRLLYGENARA